MESYRGPPVQAMPAVGGQNGGEAMKRLRRIATALAALAIPAVVAGCQPFGGDQSTPAHPSSFTNRLNESKVKPIATFDATTQDVSLYRRVTVYDASGRKLTLDASKRPLFFEAYWCPHCQRTLVLLNRHRDQLKQMPVIVSLGYAKGTNLATAKRISDEEMRAFHIQGVDVYYLLDGDHGQYSFPTLAFPYHGRVELLRGEHIFPVWQRALGGSL
jgi:thiol-disulfide isomerase/thioredoxin